MCHTHTLKIIDMHRGACDITHNGARHYVVICLITICTSIHLSFLIVNNFVQSSIEEMTNFKIYQREPVKFRSTKVLTRENTINF